MPLIDFPRVPELPGVPDLRRSLAGALVRSGIQGKLQGIDYFGLLNILTAPKWQIVSYITGEKIITPDSVVSFEYRGQSRLAGYPMEQGAFSTYNKVQTPYDIRMRMTCGGNGMMTRDEFLISMENLQKSLEIFQIVTPDRTYPRVNLERWDYKREANNGVTLLTVEALFSEIRDTASAVYGPVKEPAAEDPKSMSCLKPISPDLAGESAFEASNIA